MTSRNQIGHRKRKKASKQDKFIHDAVPISKRVAGRSLQMLAASVDHSCIIRLRDRLPSVSDGRIVYESFANAVKGRVPEAAH